ncbi:MAG: FadR family transcriptional regulator [Alphaproteobacteria bacterium]|nr:MAG: FadR family transcriptional regulator [Alphaproteobacteria bacterium]
MGRIGSADIAAAIRREISSGKLRRNERLPAERELAVQYGVARNTVRQALRRLEEEGFLEIRPGSGTYVIWAQAGAGHDAITSANPLELMDARFALEPHICRLCVLHGRRDDFERLERLCETMEASTSDPQGFSEADSDWHRVLAEATGNRLLIWVIHQINGVRGQEEWTRMRQLTLDEAMIRTYNTQHRAILDAIRLRDAERAASLMKEHLETARLSLTRAAAA